MRLVIIAFREVADGEVGIKLTEAEYEGEASTARERENAHAMAQGIATLLDAVGQTQHAELH
jgi:hypothetical protein